jgi:hypothetical protein
LVAGVDLNSKPAFNQRKLLILKEATCTKTATSADLSFSFHSVYFKRMNPISNTREE